MKIKKKQNLYAILLVFTILGISLILFRRYIFEGYYLFNKNNLSDIIRANVPTYYHMYDAIKEGGFFWSWQMGAGTSMFSHADSYFDPFVYITFIFGRNYILRMLVWMYICKLICEGLSFFAYIRYFKVDERAAVLAGVVYAFSGYSMIMGSNFALGTILVYLPLILLGAEKYMQENKKGLLFISLFLTCILSYYFFYITAIGLCIYVIYRMIYNNNFSIKKIIGFLIVGVLSIGTSMVVLLPQIELATSSLRVAGETDATTGIALFMPSLKTLFTAGIRTFSNDLLGNTYSISYMGQVYGIRDYFQETMFAGTFFFYFLLYFLSKEKNKKKFYGILVVELLCIIFPVVSFVMNAFSTINTRWMYWVMISQCIVIAFGADKLIRSKKIIHWGQYIASFVLSLLIAFSGIIVLSLGTNGAVSLDDLCNMLLDNIKWFVALYIVMPLILKIIVVLLHNRERKVFERITLVVVLGVLGADVTANYYWWYQSEYAVSEYSENNHVDYEDTSAQLIRDILPEDNEFYRINKSFDSVIDVNEIPSENDAMVQGYYGLKNYNSLGNSAYTMFLQGAGCYCTVPAAIPVYIENGVKPQDIKGAELNYINGVEDRYNLMSYLGVRYYISKQEEEETPDYFRLLSKKNGIFIYENLYYMPLVFYNKNLISQKDFLNLDNEEKDIALLTGTVIENGETSEKAKTENIQSALKNIKTNQDNFNIQKFTNDDIVGELTVPEEVKYVSTTIPYDKNWKVYVDNQEVKSKRINIGFIGFETSAGNHKVEFRYVPESFYFGAKISAVFWIFTVLILLVSYIVRGKKGKEKH